LSPQPDTDWRDDEFIEAFVTRNVGFYRDRWAKFSDSPGSKLRFNLAACLAGPAWLLYRKLYAAFWWFMLALAVDIPLFMYLDIQQVLPAWLFGLLNVVNGVLFMAVPGFFGNRWYWHRYLETLKSASDGSRGETLALLEKRGGRNLPAALTLVALFFVVPFGLAFYLTSRLILSDLVLDASGPLTVEEIEANLLWNLDLENTGLEQECMRREIARLAETAGDPETLDPSTVELLSDDTWQGLDPFTRRLMLGTVIVTEATNACL
jgi:hypothetical protein